VDLRTVARLDRWVRRLVGTIAVDELLRHGKLARLAGRVLCARALSQLSALHGRSIAHITTRRFRKYRLFTFTLRPGGADRDLDALLVWTAPMGVHSVFDVEPWQTTPARTMGC
jgi:hypothetical protein